MTDTSSPGQPWSIKYLGRSLSMDEISITERRSSIFGNREKRIPLANVASTTITRKGILPAIFVTLLTLFLASGTMVSGNEHLFNTVVVFGGLTSLITWAFVRTTLLIHPSAGEKIDFPSRPFDKPRLEAFLQRLNKAAGTYRNRS